MRTSTRARPNEDPAVPLNVTVFLSFAPDAGALIASRGLLDPGAAFWITIERSCHDCLPWASVTRTLRLCEPSGYAPVSKASDQLAVPETGRYGPSSSRISTRPIPAAA